MPSFPHGYVQSVFTGEIARWTDRDPYGLPLAVTGTIPSTGGVDPTDDSRVNIQQLRPALQLNQRLGPVSVPAHD